MKVLNKLDSLDNINDGETRKLPTKTSELTNDNYFNYSIEKASGTIDDLAAFTSGKPGLTGSINITKKDSGVGSEIPTGWYNYFFSPHRNGSGASTADNVNYGNIILIPMTAISGAGCYILRRTNSATTISEVKKIAMSSDLSNYVTLNSEQNITGKKKFDNLSMNNVNNATYSKSSTSNISPDANALSNPPWNKDLWHDHFAFMRYHSIDSQETTTDGTTWTAASKTLNNLFSQKENVNTTILTASELAYRFTFKNSTFAYSGLSWFEIGVAYTNPFSNFEVLIEHSSDNSTWSTCHQSTINASAKPFFLPNGYTIQSDGYTRFTFTKTSNLTTGTVILTCIKGLCTRKGNQGLGLEFEYPYDWDTSANLLPISNNSKSLGSSSNKWANVYATNFNGNATSATKATGDKNGNDITITYATKTELENFSRNDLAILNSKTYTGLYGSSNDQDGASFYFASVRPTNFYDVWRVKYKVYGNVPNQNNYKQYSIVELVGNQDNVSYAAFNRSYSTNYVTYYYNNVYRLTSTGYNAGYSHTLGIGLRNATNPTSSSYPRTIKIELLETENCTVSFFDEMIKRTSVSGQGSTNFGGVVEINARDNGLQETGDATNIWQLRKASGNYITSTALYRYMLLLPKNETTLIPINAVDNSTATNKTLTTEEFDPFGPIYYYNSTTAVNANVAVAGSALYYQCTLDLRYSFNTGTTLINNREVYLVAVPQSNGKAKLHSTPITQTLPTSADGKIYIYLGHTYSNYQIELSYRHPVYEYKDGAIRLYTNAIASGGGTITDVQVDGNSIVSNGVANLNTISTYNASTNPVATYNDISSKVDKEIAGASTDKTSIDHDGSLMTLEASNTNNDTESSIRLYPNGNLSLYGDNVYINNVVTPSSNGAAANKQYVDTQVATKQDSLVSGTNIKTINNQSLLGSGDIDIMSGGDTLPVGAIIPYSGSTIPTNFLLADGSAVSRTTYSELFEAIGTTYGTGDGSTTFNLPNLKGKVPVGRDSSDTSFDVLGETGGEKTHQLTVNEMPSHAHDTPIHSGGTQGLLGFMGLTNGSSSTTLSGGSTFGVKNTGGSQAHNNLQPYITQNYIIKAKKSTTALDLGYITNTYSDSTTDTYSASYINNLLDSIYPVGSIYMSVNNTNPSVLFGGTWESWGAGRVPVGVDVNDTAFDTVEETGGEKTHTLTTTEMPSHGHGVTWASNCGPWVQAGGYGQITVSATGNANRANLGGITVNNAGGGGAHNNLQPYITCYMWKRTA